MSRRPPTRDQLLELKRTISSMKKGKEILEKKRDALLQMIESDRKKFREVRETFLNSCAKIYSSYALARLHDGEASISLLGISIPLNKVDRNINQAMGCKYPSFFPSGGFPATSQLYDPMLFSLYVDLLIQDLAEAKELLWEYINLHVKLRSLERELKKTLLKINTMEQNLIPQLEAERRQIVFYLNERERQERFVTKSWMKKRELKGGN